MAQEMNEATLFAAPSAAAHGGAGGGSLEITVTLLIVIAFLAGLAWFAKRVRGGFSRGGGSRIQVLGAQSLGPKERAVLVRVGDTDILVGVAANNVNTLHVFPAGSNTQAPPAQVATPGQPDFKALLFKSLGLKDRGQ
jgi:flagellar protein FliO/FliZ